MICHLLSAILITAGVAQVSMLCSVVRAYPLTLISYEGGRAEIWCFALTFVEGVFVEFVEWLVNGTLLAPFLFETLNYHIVYTNGIYRVEFYNLTKNFNMTIIRCRAHLSQGRLITSTSVTILLLQSVSGAVSNASTTIFYSASVFPECLTKPNSYLILIGNVVSVNGSSLEHCTASGTSTNCDHVASSILFDGSIPTLNFSHSEWARELLMLDRNTDLIVRWPEYKRLSRLEVVIFNCPEWRIVTSSISFFVPGGIGEVASIITASNTSCDSLVLIELSLPAMQYSLALLQFALPPNSYMSLAEIRFYAIDSCIDTVVATSPSLASSTGKEVTTIDFSAITQSASMSLAASSVAATPVKGPPTAPTGVARGDIDLSTIVSIGSVSLFVVFITLMLVPLIACIVRRRRKAKNSVQRENFYEELDGYYNVNLQGIEIGDNKARTSIPTPIASPDCSVVIYDVSNACHAYELIERAPLDNITSRPLPVRLRTLRVYEEMPNIDASHPLLASTSTYEQALQVPNVVISELLASTGATHEKAQLYERVPDVNISQVISAVRSVYETSSIYKKVPDVDLSQLTTSVHNQALLYETVPNVDLSQIVVSAASVYERAQVYEQVPFVDISQLLSDTSEGRSLEASETSETCALVPAQTYTQAPHVDSMQILLYARQNKNRSVLASLYEQVPNAGVAQIFASSATITSVQGDDNIAGTSVNTPSSNS